MKIATEFTDTFELPYMVGVQNNNDYSYIL